MAGKHPDHRYDGLKVGLGVGIPILAGSRRGRPLLRLLPKAPPPRPCGAPGEDVLKRPGRVLPWDAEDRPGSGGESPGAGDVPLGAVAVAVSV
jgi:hypothetical protein